MIDQRGVWLALNTAMAEGFRPSIDPDDLKHVTDTTPLSRGVVRRPHRRHRWLTIPSGWVLLVCLFLPALKLCDASDPFPMVMVPFLWPPYLVGMFVALAAGAHADAVRVYGTSLLILLRVGAFGVGGCVLIEMIDGHIGASAVIVIGVSFVVFMATWRPPTERAVAANSALAAAGSFAFTLALALERLAVWGAYVGAIAAGVLLAGTLAWCLETLVQPRAAAALLK